MDYDSVYMTFISSTCFLLLILFSVKIINSKDLDLDLDLVLNAELELNLEPDLEKNVIESAIQNDESDFLHTSKNPIIFHIDDMGNDFITDSYYYVGLNQGDKSK